MRRKRLLQEHGEPGVRISTSVSRRKVRVEGVRSIVHWSLDSKDLGL